MSETVCVKGVVETVIADDHFANAGEMVDAAAAGISNVAMKAFRRAKKVGEIENARARQIVATLRAKREGTNAEPIAAHITTTSTSGQASIFDFQEDV